MPASLITIWNCLRARAWSEQRVEQKQTSPYTAGSARVETDLTDRRRAHHRSALRNAGILLRSIPGQYRRGTIAIKPGSNEQTAENPCNGSHNGLEKCRFGNKLRAGKICVTRGLTFAPESGRGCFMLNGTSFGIEICKDATAGLQSAAFDLHRMAHCLIVADHFGNHNAEINPREQEVFGRNA